MQQFFTAPGDLSLSSHELFDSDLSLQDVVQHEVLQSLPALKT